MKKFTKSLLSLAIAGAMTFPVAAIDVQLDGELVNFPDAAPEITNSRTMVPFRAMAEAMGYTVGWDDATHRVTAEHDGRTLSFSIGDNKLYIKETPDSEWDELDMDVAPYINLDRTYVPVRFFAEAFDQTVKWDDDSKTAVIYDQQGMIDSINNDFSVMNAADAVENVWLGSKSIMTYTYTLNGSDKYSAAVAVMIVRGVNTHYTMVLELGDLFDGSDFDIPMDESIAPIIGQLDGLADVELGSSEMDPEFGYSNGIYDFIDEDGMFDMDLIVDDSCVYLYSSQINKALKEAAKAEGGDASIYDGGVWLKLPATKVGYDYKNLGEMLFAMFENGDPTTIVDSVKQYRELLDYLSDKYFTQTDDGWVLDYSGENLKATGLLPADFSSFELTVTTTDENGVGELKIETDELNYTPLNGAEGKVIDLTEIDLLG